MLPAEADVELVAAEYVGRYGESAIAELQERAEQAESIGDIASSATWWEIAAAAERMIRA